MDQSYAGQRIRYSEPYKARKGIITASILIICGLLTVFLGLFQFKFGPNHFVTAAVSDYLVSGFLNLLIGLIGLCTQSKRSCVIRTYMVATILGAVFAVPLAVAAFYVLVSNLGPGCYPEPCYEPHHSAVAACAILVIIICVIEFFTNIVAACLCCSCCWDLSQSTLQERSVFQQGSSASPYQRFQNEEEERLHIQPDENGFCLMSEVSPAKLSPKMLDSDESYIMHRTKHKGLAVIINNDNFPTKRHGSKIDLRNVQHVMEQIGYEVIARENMEANEIHTVLDNVVVSINEDGPEEHSSIVIILMSHGEGRGIYGIDREVVMIKDIQTKFSGRNCPALLDKPKIIFVQACRGTMMTRSALALDSPQEATALGHLEAVAEELVCPAADSSSSHRDRQERFNYEWDTDSDLPDNADMFIAHSTSDGYFSLRDKNRGSLFISTLCEELLSAVHLDDLDTIMNRVTRRITGFSGTIMDERGNKMKALQTPQISKQGVRKKIFFMPKYPPSPSAGSDDVVGELHVVMNDK